MVLEVKNPPARAEDPRDMGSIPGSGRSPGGGYCNPLQRSCLGNPVGREPRGLQSMGPKRVGHGWLAEHATGTHKWGVC